jgi:8-oxo-dGTP pyrophosphatase MutT (NUDIX family)
MEKSERKKKEKTARTTRRRGNGTRVLIREFSAGGIVYKKTSDGEVWLLIQPKGTNRWQLPKGHLNNNESSKEAAIREVGEEGGINVNIFNKVDSQQYFYYLNGNKIFKTVTYFLMEHLQDRLEGYQKSEVEQIVYVPLTEALEMMSFKSDKEILKKANKILQNNRQKSLV